MSDSEETHNEAFYEKQLLSYTDKTTADYKRTYRRLYYLRNAETIKAYQRDYYKKRREGMPPKRIKQKEIGFKVIRKNIIIHFE
jgi:hypothetical protein